MIDLQLFRSAAFCGALSVNLLGFFVSFASFFVIAQYLQLVLGMAPVFTLTTDVIVGSAPSHRAGTASAIAETSSELGGALGIAIMGSVVTASYRVAVDRSVTEAVPLPAADAARQTLAAAVSAARTLPDPAGADLLASARAAFVDAFRLAAGISSLLALLAAVVVLLFVGRALPAPRVVQPTGTISGLPL